MPLNRGGTAIAKRFRGTQEIAKKYRGTQLIWENKPPSLMPASGATTPYVVMYVGSSTTDGQIGATDEHHNYVNHFSPMVVANAQDAYSTTKVVKQQSGTPTRPTTNGIWFYNAGLNGTNSGNYIGTDRQAVMNGLKPNLMIHMIGSNDYQAQMNPATYQSNIQSVINDARTRCPGVKHILVHSYVRLDVTAPQTYEWDAYRQRLDALAAADSDVISIRVDDLFAAQGVYKGSNDPQDLILDADNIHCTNAGYKFLAECIASRLNMNLHRAEKIWELDPDALMLTDGSPVDSLPTTAGTLETMPATQSGDQRPLLVHNAVNGRKSLKFDGVNDSIGASFSKSYGFPVTQVIVYRPNAGGTNPRPIFSRTTGAHQGYIYAFDVEAGNDVSMQSPSNAAQAKYSFTYSKTDWQVLVIVFEASDDQRVYTNNINPRVNWTDATDLSNGPFMTSQRLGSRTNLDAFSPMDLAYARLYQGALTQSEVESVLSEMGTRFNIPISTTPWPTRPVRNYLPEFGTQGYAHMLNTGSGDTNLTSVSGWTDHVHSTGTYIMSSYAASSRRLIAQGVVSYKPYNNYYYTTQLANANMFVRVKVYNPPGTPANSDAGCGIAFRHTGTNTLIFKVMANGNWRVIRGASATSDNTNTADPTPLAEGTMPYPLIADDELTVVCVGNTIAVYWNDVKLTQFTSTLNNTARRFGVHITQGGGGELYDLKAGVATAIP